MLVKTATACRSFPFSMIMELLSQDQLPTSSWIRVKIGNICLSTTCGLAWIRVKIRISRCYRAIRQFFVPKKLTSTRHPKTLRRGRKGVPRCSPAQRPLSFPCSFSCRLSSLSQRLSETRPAHRFSDRTGRRNRRLCRWTSRGSPFPAARRCVLSLWP